MSGQRDGYRVVLDREYEGTTGTLHLARTDVIDCLRPYVSDSDVHERAQLVVSELASNAIQASPGSVYSLRVSLTSDGAVVMAVKSSTAHDAPPPREGWRPASVIAPKGRGLMIVGRLTEDVDIERPDAGTIVVTATLR